MPPVLVPAHGADAIIRGIVRLGEPYGVEVRGMVRSVRSPQGSYSPPIQARQSQSSGDDLARDLATGFSLPGFRRSCSSGRSTRLSSWPVNPYLDARTERQDVSRKRSFPCRRPTPRCITETCVDAGLSRKAE
jgi:hypothetical protein